MPLVTHPGRVAEAPKVSSDVSIYFLLEFSHVKEIDVYFLGVKVTHLGAYTFGSGIWLCHRVPCFMASPLPDRASSRLTSCGLQVLPSLLLMERFPSSGYFTCLLLLVVM